MPISNTDQNTIHKQRCRGHLFLDDVLLPFEKLARDRTSVGASDQEGGLRNSAVATHASGLPWSLHNYVLCAKKRGRALRILITWSLAKGCSMPTDETRLQLQSTLADELQRKLDLV
jgi:hypothetical protein